MKQFLTIFTFISIMGCVSSGEIKESSIVMIKDASHDLHSVICCPDMPG